MSKREEDFSGTLIEEARRVLEDRIDVLGTWLDKTRAHLATTSLYELEADLQIIEVVAQTTAEQVLRVITETGELRDAGIKKKDQRRDEVRDQRDTHH